MRTVTFFSKRRHREPYELSFARIGVIWYSRARVHRVAIMNQKPKRLIITELHHQIARLLRRPGAIWVRRAGDVLDSSRRERDEEQHVEPLQERGLDGEEVASERGRRLLAQKRAARTSDRAQAESARRPSRSTVRTVVAETKIPSPVNSPTIPPVSSARVLVRKPQDQCH